MILPHFQNPWAFVLLLLIPFSSIVVKHTLSLLRI